MHRAFGAVGDDDHLLTFERRLLGEEAGDAPLLWRRIAGHHRPVNLVRSARFEHFAEMGRRGSALGHNQTPRGVAVEPVHEARRLALLVGEAFEQSVHVALGAAATLRGKAVRLVEDINVVVFVKDQIP